jgi:hypothetical protein
VASIWIPSVAFLLQIKLLELEVAEPLKVPQQRGLWLPDLFSFSF